MNFVKKFILCSILISFYSNVLLTCEPANADTQVSSVELKYQLLQDISSFYKTSLPPALNCPEKIHSKIVSLAFERRILGINDSDIVEQAQEDANAGEIVSELGKSLKEEIENIKREVSELKFEPFSLPPLEKHKELMRKVKSDNPGMSESFLRFVSHVFSRISERTLPTEWLEIGYIANDFTRILARVDSSMIQGIAFAGNKEKMDLFLPILQKLLEQGDIQKFYIDVYNKTEAKRQTAFLSIFRKIRNMYRLCAMQKDFLEFEKNQQLKIEADRKKMFDDHVALIEQAYHDWKDPVDTIIKDIENLKNHEEYEKNFQIVAGKEKLLKIEKLEKICEIEQRDFFQTQETWEKERFKILKKSLEELKEKILKITTKEEKAFWNQIMQDFEYGAAGHAVVKRCEWGMSYTFHKYLKPFKLFVKKSKQLAVDCEEEKTKEQRQTIEKKQLIGHVALQQKEILDLQLIQSAAIQEQETLNFKKIEEIQKIDQKSSYLQRKNNNKIRALWLSNLQQFAKEHKKVREQRAIQEDESILSANIEQEEVLDLQLIDSAAVQEQEILNFKEIEKIHEVDQRLSYLQEKNNNKVRALCLSNWQQLVQEDKKVREQQCLIAIEEEQRLKKVNVMILRYVKKYKSVEQKKVLHLQSILLAVIQKEEALMFEQIEKIQKIDQKAIEQLHSNIHGSPTNILQTPQPRTPKKRNVVIVSTYDNEPLPPLYNQVYNQVLPSYRRTIRESVLTPYRHQ